MDKKSEIVPKKNSIRDLLSLYYFKIPLFQRSYCWSIENWEDFWSDLTIHMGKAHDFFLGSIVVKDLQQDATVEVIDGQQRITTCIILLAAIRDYLLINKNDLGKEIQTYISHKEALRLAQSRLNLNKSDDQFFQENIISPKNEIDKVKSRGLSLGERNIRKAYKFFREKIGPYSASIDKLLGNLLDRTYVIVIQVVDDIQAYTVFETLNARGLDLSAADLIKNSVFAKASDKGILDKVIGHWSSVTQRLANYSVTLFLKYYISMLRGVPIREKDLFKQIKTSGYIENDVLRFAKEVEEIAETYSNLLDPTASFWENKEIPGILNNINIMRLKTCYPLLVAIALSPCKTSIKKELFSEVEKLGFRYSIIMNKNPNELEVKYASWANKLFRSKISADELRDEINKAKPSNKEFQGRFINKSLAENQIVSYILKKIGIKLTGDDILSINDSVTVEHVLPCKPEKWEKYIKEHNDLSINGEKYEMKDYLEEVTYRLGNQTLLLGNDNSKIGNEIFDKKKKEYGKSNFIFNKMISKEKIWSLKEIEKYQKIMTNSAIEIW